MAVLLHQEPRLSARFGLHAVIASTQAPDRLPVGDHNLNDRHKGGIHRATAVVLKVSG